LDVDRSLIDALEAGSIFAFLSFLGPFGVFPGWVLYTEIEDLIQQKLTAGHIPDINLGSLLVSQVPSQILTAPKAGAPPGKLVFNFERKSVTVDLGPGGVGLVAGSPIPPTECPRDPQVFIYGPAEFFVLPGTKRVRATLQAFLADMEVSISQMGLGPLDPPGTLTWGGDGLATDQHSVLTEVDLDVPSYAQDGDIITMTVTAEVRDNVNLVAKGAHDVTINVTATPPPHHSVGVPVRPPRRIE
jgi:hypothetical protein